MKTTDLKLGEELVNLEFSRYFSNNALAIIAKENNGEVYDYLTTNNSIEEDVFNLETNNLVQIRSDYPQYSKFLIENDFVMPELVYSLPSGYIFIEFFEPTEKFLNYLKRNKI